MAYIVVLNPIILSGADVDGNSLPFAGVAAVTALIAGVMTILMGVVGRYPFAVATGLGSTRSSRSSRSPSFRGPRSWA